MTDLPVPSPSEAQLATLNDGQRLSYILDQLRALNGDIVNGDVVNVSSDVVANDVAVATLPAVADKTNYITGFEVTGLGATAGVGVNVVVSGLIGDDLTYVYAAAAGALVENTPLMVKFPQPIPAADVNTAITVTCPALGTGNTKNVVNVHGFVR